MWAWSELRSFVAAFSGVGTALGSRFVATRLRLAGLGSVELGRNAKKQIPPSPPRTSPQPAPPRNPPKPAPPAPETFIRIIL